MNNKQFDLTINNLKVYDNDQLEKTEYFVCSNDKSVLQIKNATFENNIGGILTIIPDILHFIYLSNVSISNNTANDDNSLFYVTNGNVSDFENSNIGLHDITFVENSRMCYLKIIIVCIRMIM